MLGISISIITGDDGVINKAGQSKENTIIDQEKNQIASAWKSMILDKTKGKIDYHIDEGDYDAKFNEKLKKDIDNIKVRWYSECNYYKVFFKETNHTYSVETNGSINLIENDESLILGKTITVTFDANGGNALSESTKKVIEGMEIGNLPTVSKNKFEFDGWYTEENEKINENSIMGENDVTYYAHWIIKVNQNVSLSQAINEIEANGIQTEIKMESNRTEHVIINENQNILLDLQNNTLNNTVSKTNAIKNYGKLELKNGTVQSNSNWAAIDNESTGVLIIKDLMVLGGQSQGMCNNGGDLYIEENAQVSTSSNSPALQNRYRNERGGNLYIINGTILATNYAAIVNEAKCKLIIGTKDNSVNINSPIIQGKDKAIGENGEIYFYDGTIKGTTTANLSTSLNIVDKENKYSLEDSTETINNTQYKTLYLVKVIGKIVFDPNGGTVETTQRDLHEGMPIGELPIPERIGYDFVGWFTSANGGVQITADTLMNENNTIYYAHWEEIFLAEINGKKYKTLQEAVSDVKENEQTTVKLLRNTSEKITVVSGQNIIFDLQDFTISNNGTNQVIDNSGSITIQNGTITSSASTGAINNNAGATLIMTGGRIVATGNRQAIWNNGGTVKISGTSYINAKAQVASNNKRGSVRNLNSGNLEITGGTIISEENSGIAVSNDATMTIGTQGGEVSTVLPEMQGKGYGIYSTKNFNFFDGIVKGVSDAFNDESKVTKETGYEFVRTTEVISGSTYKVVCLGEI